jgi:hypothetical protein
MSRSKGYGIPLAVVEEFILDGDHRRRARPLKGASSFVGAHGSEKIPMYDAYPPQMFVLSTQTTDRLLN